tara:strand:+ start:325 stop:861 length:537 start_codon:yes stop_codon:yes gene_type:complete
MTTTKTFNGGIQKGTVATDARARKMDNYCKELRESVFANFKSKDLTVQKKLNQTQIPGGIGACEPDGGAWFYKGILIAVFEGKKQQNRGNAIERWFKNNFICRSINPQVSYVTFATGEGAKADGTIGKALNIAHLNGFNKYVPGGNSCFMNTDTIDKDEMNSIMHEVILERMEAVDNL